MLSRLTILIAPAATVFGAAVFFVASVYLAIERCSSGCTGFLEGMNRTPALSTSGQVIIGLVCALAFVGRWGRGIAGGFLVALAATAIGTAGSATFMWGIPNGHDESPTASRATKRIGARILELQKQPPDERLGGLLIYRVLDCIADKQPASPADIASGDCRDLETSLEGYSGPERFNDADRGWRWSYSKDPAGFRVAVYLDVMLGKTNPQFEAENTTGIATVLRGDSPPVQYPRPR